MLFHFAFWLLLAVSVASGIAAEQPLPGAAQQVRHFEGRVEVPCSFDYLLFLPHGYEKSKQRWPLMLFLHGAGESGTNLSSVKKLGPPMLVETNRDFPFVLVSPQTRVRTWNADLLNGFLNDILRRYRVDKNRVYLTGASMGGSGAWAFAAAYPERFAAMAPLCGSGDPAEAKKLARLPIWVFQGAKDPVVSFDRAQAMVDAVKAAGGNIKFTIYPDAGHDVWTSTYANPELYAWLLKQTRRERRGSASSK
jgi:predicted peptidase